MKKIIRLTENDLVKLVKRVISEEITQKDDFTKTPIRLYLDEQNTNDYAVVKFKKINVGEYDIKLTEERRGFNNMELSYEFKCENNFIKPLFTSSHDEFYNKLFINDLKTKYCTKSSGGTDVMNIGKYSSVNTNTPNNFS